MKTAGVLSAWTISTKDDVRGIFIRVLIDSDARSRCRVVVACSSSVDRWITSICWFFHAIAASSG